MSESEQQPSARVTLLIAALFLSVVGTGVVYLLTEFSSYRPWPFLGMIALTTLLAWALFTTPKDKQFIRVRNEPISKWLRVGLTVLGSALLVSGVILLAVYLPRLVNAWQHNEAKRFFDYFKTLLLPLWLLLLGSNFLYRGLKQQKANHPE